MATDRLTREQEHHSSPRAIPARHAANRWSGRLAALFHAPTFHASTGGFLLMTGVIAAAAMARLIPHPWNFTPIGAMALFAGAHIRNRPLALLVPLLAMAASDLFLPRDVWQVHATIYATFAVIVGLGMVLGACRAKMRVGEGRMRAIPAARGAINLLLSSLWIGSFALWASLLFFAVTNFACWQVHPIYEKTPGGLLACYAAAIPFFGNMAAGDLFYSLVLFGGYALIASLAAALRQAKVVGAFPWPSSERLD
jgi:hypothetical protein